MVLVFSTNQVSGLFPLDQSRHHECLSDYLGLSPIVRFSLIEIPRDSMHHHITNSSAYVFCSLTRVELETLKSDLVQLGATYGESQLCGTILLSEEGLNLRLSGTHEAIEAFQAYFSTHTCVVFRQMKFKNSFSLELTLRRYWVKIKKEIIALGMDTIQPARQGRAAHISPEEFQVWMREKKHEMLILDTRNDYEVRLGTFEGAKDLNIRNFRAFPEAAQEQLGHVAKDTPVVMFCTGGVRCEKASYCLREQGFNDVYQLDGGILNYFETFPGGPHYDGQCYIFDDRVALNCNLEEDTSITSCYKCRSPLTREEQALESFQPNHSCKYCCNGKQDFRHAPSSSTASSEH